MASHSSTLAWKIPWAEEPGRLQSMGSGRVGHNRATSLSLFTFMLWRRKWQPTPVFLPGESQGRGSLVGCHLRGHTELDTIGVTWQQRQHKPVCMLSHFSHIQLCAIIRTGAHRAPLSKEFSRQEYWSGLPCPPPGDLPDPGIKPVSLTSLALAGRFFTTSTTWEASISLGGQQTVELLDHLLWKGQGRARAEAVLGFGALREPEALVEHGNIPTGTGPGCHGYSRKEAHPPSAPPWTASLRGPGRESQLPG